MKNSNLDFWDDADEALDPPTYASVASDGRNGTTQGGIPGSSRGQSAGSLGAGSQQKASGAHTYWNYSRTSSSVALVDEATGSQVHDSCIAGTS